MSDTPLPRHVYLDTGLLVAASSSSSLNADAGRAFCERLIAENCRVYFSQILRLELTESIRKLATIPGRVPQVVSDEFDLAAWQHQPAVRRHWLQTSVQQFESLLERFAVVYETPFNRIIWLRSVEIMAHLQVRSHDAIHLATASQNGVRCIATTDDDFLKIPDLDIRLIRDSTN